MHVRRPAAAVGSLFFLVLAPGATAVLIPWLLTGWRERVPPPGFPIRLAGVALIVAGAAVLLSAFARFVLEGGGTSASVAPTQKLVVGGLYRYVRNPMYLAVAATIVGQAMLLGRPELVSTPSSSLSRRPRSLAGTRSRRFGSATVWASCPR